MQNRSRHTLRHFVLTLVPALSVSIMMPIIAPGAQDSVKTMVLEHGGREGEVFSVDIKGQVDISINIGGDASLNIRAKLVQRLEHRVEEVRFNGDTATTIRMRRAAAETYIHGRTVKGYDTNRHGDRAIMRTKKKLAPILMLLESSMLLEQGPDGVIKDFVIEGPNRDVKQQLEQRAEGLMRNNLIQYPLEPVGIGDTWLAATKSVAFPTIGQLNFDLVAKLVAIDPGDGFQNAAIAITAKNGRFESISKEEEILRIKSFEISGSAVYAGRYHRIVSFVFDGELVLVPPPGTAKFKGLRARFRSEAAQVQAHQEPKLKQVEECPLHVPVGPGKDGAGPRVEMSKGQEVSEDRKSVAIFHNLIGNPTCRLHLDCALPASASENLDFQHFKQMKRLSNTSEPVFVGSYISPGMKIRATLQNGNPMICGVERITNF
jgi:hypothetical protein